MSIRASIAAYLKHLSPSHSHPPSSDTIKPHLACTKIGNEMFIHTAKVRYANTHNDEIRITITKDAFYFMDPETCDVILRLAFHMIHSYEMDEKHEKILRIFYLKSEKTKVFFLLGN